MRAFFIFVLFFHSVSNAATVSTTPSKISKATSGTTLVDHHLLTWNVPKGWDVSLPPSPAAIAKESYETDIELKKNQTTISLFISKGVPPNILDIEQARMALEKGKKLSREQWNGETWLIANFEKKDRKSGALQAVTFASAQRKGNLFSVIALTPRDRPDAEIIKVLNAIALK